MRRAPASRRLEVGDPVSVALHKVNRRARDCTATAPDGYADFLVEGVDGGSVREIGGSACAELPDIPKEDQKGLSPSGRAHRSIWMDSGLPDGRGRPLR